MNFSEIERNLNLNKDIQADIRQIVYECYYDIYNYLGRTGFIKWVDKQNLTIGIRDIIFKALTENEDEYLKNNNYDNLKHFNNENESYGYIDDLLKDGDLVLFKGSHGMHLSNIIKYLVDNEK